MKRRRAILLLISSVGLVIGYRIIRPKINSEKPDFNFLDKNRELIASLVDVIIPETDIIGARNAGVHDYLIQIIKYSLPYDEANVLINGFKQISDKTYDKYAKNFEKCSYKERNTLINSYLNQSFSSTGIFKKIKNKYLGKSFFDLIKKYTVEGFCTSREGASTALIYLPIPGSFIRCFKIDKNHKVWAL